MKKLYLIRHAKSSWKMDDLNDYDRPLNNRGKISADFMGKKLYQNGIKPDKIIASPAKRTQRTAERIAQKTGYPNVNISYFSELYLANLNNLMEIINSISNEHECVFLIGHNPGISVLNDHLTDQFINMVTCAISEIEIDLDKWQEISQSTGVIKSFSYPKKYDEFNQLLNA